MELKTKLILVTGLTNEDKSASLSPSPVVNFDSAINCIKPLSKVHKIWFDPFIKPVSRAVALLEKELDLDTINYCINQKGLQDRGSQLFCETVTPPQSIIVGTNGAIRHGALDKLKFLFSSKKLGGKKVLEVKKLRAEFFEMIFEDGWDAVLAVCLISWQVNNTNLTLCPYFDCYKEPPFNQLKIQDYSSQENITAQDSKKQEPSSEPLLAFQKLNDKTKNTTSAQINRKKSSLFFRNKMFPLLLNLLDCKTAVQTCYSEVIININPMEMEAEIEGPEQLIKSVHQAISSEESKISLTDTKRQFLEDPIIEKYLTALAKERKWHLDLKQTQLGFVVIDSSRNKASFPEFVKSLVIVKTCLSLSLKDFQDSQEWIIFRDSFNIDHPYKKIIVCNNCVTILALMDQEQDLNFAVNMVNSKLQEISSAASYEKEMKFSHTISPNAISISKILKDMNEPIKSSSETSRVKISLKKNIIWLLKILHFNEAVGKINRAITMDINEENCEILVEGPTYGINLIKDIVMSDKNKISIAKEEENLLLEQHNRQQIELKAKQAKWHIVLDGQLIQVEIENTEKMTFQRFSSEMLIKSGCLEMSSGSYQENVLFFNDTFFATETGNIPSSSSFTILSLPSSSQDIVDEISSDAKSDDVTATNNAIPTDSNDMALLSNKLCPDFCKTLDNNSKLYSRGKAKKKSCSIICKHTFFAWVLEVLGLESAVNREYQGLLFRINSLDNELHIKGFAEDVEKLKRLIMTFEGKISFTDEEEIFLSNEETLHYIDSIIQKSGLYVDLPKDEDKIILKDKNGQEIDLEEFVNSLIIKKRCRSLPTTDYKDNQEWEVFTSSLLHYTPPGQIIVKGRNVTLYTVGIESNTMLLTSKINDFIDNINQIRTMDDEKQKDKNHPSVPSESYSSEIFVKQTISVQSLISKFDNFKDNTVKVSNTEFMKISQQPGKVLVADKVSAENPFEVSITTTKNVYSDEDKGSSSNQDTSEIYTFTTHNSTYTGIQTHCTERKCYKILKDDVRSSSNLTRSISSENHPVMDFYPLSPQEYKYFENFFQDQLNHLESKHSSDIKLSFHGIDVQCRSKVILHKIFAELKTLLGEIHFEDKLITYPGLLTFIHSTDGEKLVKKLATDYECLLEIPDLKLFYSGDICKNLEYKVIVLCTVTYKGFNMHIAFGHISNIKVDLTVDFKINDEVTRCEVEPQRENIVIKLPLLRQHDENVKKSFKQTLKLIIEQILYNKYQSVAISTAHMHDEENSVYIDYLFGTLPSELMTTKSHCDIYIIEPYSKAVFDTFVDVWKSYQVPLEVPRQSSWERIGFPETKICLDYTSLKIKVTVQSCSSNMNHRKTLWCYPVLPSLDVSSCPVLHEPFCSQSFLEQEIKKFKKFCPKGLDVGDSFHIKSSIDYTDILLYCCPEWGFDSVMAIHDALETILLHSSEFEYVHIIPPGLHVNPKFPKLFLAWKIFQILDILLSSEKNIFLQKKIIFIIEDEEYRQAFELQLRKRYSKAKMDLGRESLDNKDTANKTCKDKLEHSNLCSLRNKIPKQLLSFWGTSAANIKEAEIFFIKHLDNLMKESKVTMSPDKLFIDKVENVISSMKDVPVSLLLEKNLKKASRTNHLRWSLMRKTKDQDEEVESATLYIQGLSKESVKTFIEEITNK